MLKNIHGWCLLVLVLLWASQAQVRAAGVEGLVNDKLSSLHSYLAVISFSPAVELELVIWQQGESWRQEWILGKDDSKLLLAAVGKGFNFLAAYPDREGAGFPLLQLWYNSKGDFGWLSPGLELDKRGYAFQRDLPCQVLGGSGPGAAQVWVDVQQNLPRRLVLPSGQQLDWRQYQEVGNIPLPHLVRIQSKNLRLEGDIVWKAVNTPFPQRLFLRDSVPQGQAPIEASQATRQVLHELSSLLPRVD
ncbi:MAG: hypothetical protein ACOC3Y_03105 [Desulfohalobiaceae bacterium]